jgi:ribonuclease Z
MKGRLLVLALGVFSLFASGFLVWAMWRYQALARDVAWLEDQRYPTLTLVTAGTGSATENPSRLGPVSAVGLGSRIVLVDAGRGVAEALRRCLIRPSQPDTVLLSSLLPENTVGLDDLLASGWLAGRAGPLRVVGPPGTRALAESVVAAQAPALRALGDTVGWPAPGATIEAVDAEDGWSEAREGLSVRAGAAGATPLPSLAWRFEAGPVTLVVSGSGPDPAALAAFARGAGLLASEGFFRESVDLVIEAGDPDAERLRREADLHLPLPEAGEVAAQAGVPLLVLTRLRPPPFFAEQYRTAAGERFDGRVVVAGECDSFSGAAR